MAASIPSGDGLGSAILREQDGGISRAAKLFVAADSSGWIFFVPHFSEGDTAYRQSQLAL